MKTVVALGDLHCGHVAGLTPAGWFSGNRAVRKMQEACWRNYTRLVENNKKPDILFVLGDCIDGRGEKSGGTELVTPDRYAQAKIAVECLEMWEAKKIVMVYGTPYHTGCTEDFEEYIADKLDAKIKSHAFVDVEGVVFDLKHDCGGSQVPQGRHTAVAKDRLWNIMWNEMAGQPKSDVILRGHVHYFNYCGGRNWMGMTLPALQAAHTKYGARRCRGTVDWGIVKFTVANGRYAWTPEIIGLADVAEKAIKL